MSAFREYPAISKDPAQHCFRVDNCCDHPDHKGDNCCCCGLPADSHTGCDCVDGGATKDAWYPQVGRAARKAK